MTTPTTTFSFGKPINGADSDTWGTELNAFMDALDALLTFYLDPSESFLKAPGTITAHASAAGSGDGPVVLNAGLVTALANNGTHTLITLGQGQTAFVFACQYINGGINNYVRAICIYDGIQDAQILDKNLVGSGIDLVGSGANVQVKNTTGGSVNVTWRTT